MIHVTFLGHTYCSSVCRPPVLMQMYLFAWTSPYSSAMTLLASRSISDMIVVDTPMVTCPRVRDANPTMDSGFDPEQAP
ncbi:unnamed protein product [Danaus chrysippus]|uniref:(African queen) hypothetical protein n=1 Tax=Danaus chrysippus TaxID=151541 RepID=A0A8J2R3T8_9NEOP|nr:unnamed protein product [Danaus chrysippus]